MTAMSIGEGLMTDQPNTEPGPPVHFAWEVAAQLPLMPLCWVAEAQSLHPDEDHAELWAISFDHDAVPGYKVAFDWGIVGCRNCHEWRSA